MAPKHCSCKVVENLLELSIILLLLPPRLLLHRLGLGSNLVEFVSMSNIEQTREIMKVFGQDKATSEVSKCYLLRFCSQYASQVIG